MRIISAVLEKKEGSGSSRDCNCRRKIEILLMLGSRMMLGLFFPAAPREEEGGKVVGMRFPKQEASSPRPKPKKKKKKTSGGS